MPVQGLGELVNGKKYFEQLREDGPVPLQPHVAGPFDEACVISLGPDARPMPKFLDFFSN